ncbi:hypothetical protein XENOCAPTIV_020301, partial [Xenoophorus captivus]
LVQLSAGPAGFLETDGVADRTPDGPETTIRRHGMGQEDRLTNKPSKTSFNGELGSSTNPLHEIRFWCK